MKRVLASILVIACLLSMTACSQSLGTSEPSTNQGTTMPKETGANIGPTIEPTTPTLGTDPSVTTPATTEPTEPVTRPTDPIKPTNPTEPVTEPTEPSCTEPSVKPPEPTTNPTDSPSTESSPPPTVPENNSTEDYAAIAKKYVGRWYLDGYADVYIDVTVTQGEMYIEATNYSLYAGPGNDCAPGFIIYPQTYFDPEIGGEWVSGTGIGFRSWNNDLSNQKIQLHEDNIQISEHLFVREKGTIADHVWSDATCTEPKICTICGVTEGTALGHAWIDASCTNPKTCSLCGAMEGETIDHSWKEDPAGSQEPNCLQEGFIYYVCSVCGETQTEYIGFGDHSYGDWTKVKEPTCTDGQEYRECRYCYNRETRPIAGSGHDWPEAVCANPRVCAKCGLREYRDVTHSWQITTCAEPKVCTVCGTVELDTEHSYKNGICADCGTLEPSAGLKFEEIDGEIYVSGIGTCTDKNIVIPNSYNNMPVTGIGIEAFMDGDFESIFIPDSVTKISACAFDGCTNLKEIQFGDNSQLSIICSGAFKDCTSLTGITLPKGVTSLGAPEGSHTGGYVFRRCRSLTSIAIPDGVTEIGQDTFSGCTSLASITFGEESSVTSIGSCAFYKCTELTTITLPASVSWIDSCAFEKCTNLETVTFARNSQLTVIVEWTFEECENLNAITLPKNLASIKSFAFSDCYNLSNITYPGTMKQWNALELEDNWSAFIAATEVICSDGIVSITD